MELWLDDVLFLIVISLDSASYYLHTPSHTDMRWEASE